jgi:hypothetical protein
MNVQYWDVVELYALLEEVPSLITSVEMYAGVVSPDDIEGFGGVLNRMRKVATLLSLLYHKNVEEMESDSASQALSMIEKIWFCLAKMQNLHTSWVTWEQLQNN